MNLFWCRIESVATSHVLATTCLLIIGVRTRSERQQRSAIAAAE